MICRVSGNKMNAQLQIMSLEIIIENYFDWRQNSFSATI